MCLLTVYVMPPQVTRINLPGLPPPYLHTARIIQRQEDVGMAWERGSLAGQTLPVVGVARGWPATLGTRMTLRQANIKVHSIVKQQPVQGH